MKDYDIRVALHAHLLGKNPSTDTRIRDELGLCAGAGADTSFARVDVAVLNGEFAGYEIKSDHDTLRRLSGQAFVYGHVLDSVTLVATSKHLDKAAVLLPPWWGLMAAHEKGSKVKLKQVRKPRRNPRLHSFSLAQLLWRDEALAVLRDRGLLVRGLSRMPLYYLWRALARGVPKAELRDIVRERIKARPKSIGGPLYGPSGAMSPIATTG